MPKVKFSETVCYETEGRNQGPTFHKGRTYTMADDHAQRWVRRNVAVVVDEEESEPAEDVHNLAKELQAKVDQEVSKAEEEEEEEEDEAELNRTPIPTPTIRRNSQCPGAGDDHRKLDIDIDCCGDGASGGAPYD